MSMSKPIRTVGRFLLILVALLVACEFVARLYFGLGDPPLTVRDPEVEYFFKPGEYHRFGNTIFYNEYSMRSPPPPSRSERGRGGLTILVLGDSVVNGGSLTDQQDLATEILAGRLPDNSWVGNASAGSWGPANIAAYVRKHGTFSADLIIVVLNSEDLNDVPQFKDELGPNFPQTAPATALQEVWERYLPRYLPFLVGAEGRPGARIQGPNEGADHVLDLVNLLAATRTRVQFVLHPGRSELSSGPNEMGRALRRLLQQQGVSYIEAGPYLEARNYRDGIHINAEGQSIYADLFFRITSLTKSGT